MRAIKSLAEKLSRRPEEIVIVYRDEPIHATGLAPMALGMGDEVELGRSARIRGRVWLTSIQSGTKRPCGTGWKKREKQDCYQL